MLHYVIQWLYVRMYVELSIVVYFVTTPSAKIEGWLCWPDRKGKKM